MRVKRGVVSRRRHQKLRKLAEGFRGRKKSCYSIVKRGVEKSMLHAYKGRKQRKREFRALWIQRINAGVRELDMTYGNFIHGLNLAGIEVDRKVLADLAVREPESFKAIVEQAKAALA